MKIKTEFLTHYKGDTNRDATVKERLAWASTDIELRPYAMDALAVVLQDNPLYETTAHGDRVFALAGHYYADVETLNASSRKYTGCYGDYLVNDRETKGRPNFLRDAQRQFCWNAFGFAFLRRPAAGYAYGMEPGKIKQYRPGGDIEWDDTAEIGKLVREYCQRNMIFADDHVLCRIEAPLFFDEKETYPRHNRVYTPYGGYGDPVGGLGPHYYDTDGLRTLRDPKGKAEGTSAVRFDPLDEHEPDFAFRDMRAVFLGIFCQVPWLDQQPRFTRSKARAKVGMLHELFRASYPTIDDDVLDRAADIIRTITEVEDVTAILDAWANRPISIQ